MSVVDCLLLIDKPKGWTSFDVVAKVRGILREAERMKSTRLSHGDAAQGGQEERASRTSGTVSERQTPADTAMRSKHAGVAGTAGQHGSAVRKIRVGHSGTLDPLATGLLIVLVGSYCKRASEYSKLDKTYEVELLLGQTSATDDEEGEKTVINAEKPSEDDIKQVLSGFVGGMQQTPPAYSAIKVDGKRAYKLARAGKDVKLEPRAVTIYSIEDISYDYPYVRFTTKVSSGTYIRSLARDIGDKLGTGAYMSNLRRTTTGQFSVDDAHKIDSLNTENIVQKIT